MQGRFALNTAARASGSYSASSWAVGSWPSRRTRSRGPLNAFSSGTCWSSSIPMSRASGSRESNSLASGSIGSAYGHESLLVAAAILARRGSVANREAETRARPGNMHRTGWRGTMYVALAFHLAGADVARSAGG